MDESRAARAVVVPVVLALALLPLLSGCTSATYSGSAVSTVDCDALLDRVVEREKRGNTSGAINGELDVLSDQCSSEYWVFVDYQSIKMFSSDTADDSCLSYREFDVEPLAIELARRDGFCSDSGSRTAAGSSATDSRSGSRGPGAPEWTCRYQPSYNNDWHDDVLCSNGTESHRPYLREWDNFVTEDEIMGSAREYERQLNGQS